MSRGAAAERAAEVPNVDLGCGRCQRAPPKVSFLPACPAGTYGCSSSSPTRSSSSRGSCGSRGSRGSCGSCGS